MTTVATPVAAAPRVDVAPPGRPSVWRRLGAKLAKLVLPLWTALVILFLFTPIFFLIAMSFNDFKTIFLWTRFSTHWWGDMWSNTTMTDAVITSLEVAVISTIIALALGTLAGVALARRPGKWTVLFVALVLLILVTPEIVDGAGQLSWFVKLDDWVGGPFRTGLTPIILVHTVFSSAVVTLIVRARVAGLDPRMEEAAADLFATPTKAFFQITLPLVMPAVLAGAMLAFTLSLDNVVATSFVSPAGKTTFPNYVFGLAGGVIRPEVAAMSTVFIGITLVAIGLVAVVLRLGGQTGTEIAAQFTGN
jgi:ABC-type spermidine/putrescine transport system permease subunit II